MLIRTLYAAGAVAAIGLMVGVAYDAGSRHSAVGQAEGQPETQTEAQPGMDDMTQMDPAAMIQMMRETSAPDEHHHFLKKFAGEFDCTLKFWMEPDAEPETSKGTTSSTWELGGRFLRSDFAGAFAFGGNEIPLDGIGYMGFDRNKGKFFTTWMDSMSTGPTILFGEADMTAGTITVEGATSSVMGESRLKNVYTLTDKGFTLEFFEPNPTNPNGELMKTAVIEYTRK